MSTKVDPAENPKVEHNVRAFLKALNSSGGKPLETMSPGDARQVLVGAQASVKLKLAPCDIEDRTITQDGLDVPITIVRPAGLKEKAVRDALHQAAEMLRKHLK
jgi:acetyl esterase